MMLLVVMFRLARQKKVIQLLLIMLANVRLSAVVLILYRAMQESRLDQQIIGGTANTMYQIVTDKMEGIKLEKFFNSKFIRFLLNITQYSAPPNYINEFKILNLISIPEYLPDNPTDEDIYEYYDLTQDEIDLIEEIVPDTPITRKSKRNSK